MSITIALAGNPNSGKTTLFNHLTGSNQYVGNWPGVTVERKEGLYKQRKDVKIQDLPGVYSLSPYTLEEVVTRNYLVNDRPNVIINIVDGTNIERNLYLTTQLLELGTPVIVAINMIDLVRKSGDQINLSSLSKALHCPVVEISALQSTGTQELLAQAIALAEQGKQDSLELAHVFHGPVEHALAHIEESLEPFVPLDLLRWYGIKVFERDHTAIAQLNFDLAVLKHIEEHIVTCEDELEDDTESIITNQRYAYIEQAVRRSIVHKNRGKLSASDKIDKIVTNRILALPIFAAVMFMVYFISITTVGAWLTDFTNDVLFAEGLQPLVATWLESMGVAAWMVGLIVEGIIGGVGAVLGFVPQMLILFMLLAILEDCGYMARVAFIMDRLFRKFGLSGKSFIPMLIGSGCSVPGIMASRTIEQQRDRRMTIMTTSFIPCSAKMPIVALIAGALFGGAWWVAPLAYFIGVAAVIVSGIILKKMPAFAGRPAPFVMELPSYHVPSTHNIVYSTWERGSSFIKRAGTVILLSAIVLWFLQAFGYEEGVFTMVEDNNTSLLANLGKAVAPLFAPLGFGSWQAAVGTFTGLIAKENVVGTFGVLYGFAEVAEAGEEYWSLFARDFTTLSSMSFLIFNLLCAPCFADIGAIKREMNHAKWTWFAVGYMTGFAWVVSLIVYQVGLLLTGAGFTLWTGVALALAALMLYLLLRPASKAQEHYKEALAWK